MSGYSIMVIISAFQADDAGSIPATRSKRIIIRGQASLTRSKKTASFLARISDRIKLETDEAKKDINSRR